MISASPPTPSLMPHQEQAVDFMVDHPFAGIWIEIAGGKSLSTLTALQRIRPLGHILVIAPVAIARSTWFDEIAAWQMPIRTQSLIVNERDVKLPKAKRLELFQRVFTDPPTMYFINQELISRPPRRTCADCQGLGAKGRACVHCQTGLVDQMPIQKINGHDTIVWPFPTVIIDEAQEFKSHASNRFKALAKVRPAITRLIELTGAPAPNGLHDLWSQIFLLDQGQALGANITAFRERWFTPKMLPGQTIPVDWIPNAGAEQEIHRAISHLVMSAENTSVIMPPEPVLDDVKITLDADLLTTYRHFKRELVLDIVKTYTDENGQLAQTVASIIADNQAVLTSKLMQFASGTLYTSDPDDPSTAGQYEVIHDEKIRATERIIRRAAPEPVLVAYQFKSDKEQLLAKLSAAGLGIEAFNGSRDMVSRWNRREIPVMLIHPASAGAGLNLQHGGSHLVWFTVPFSLNHYQQTNGRLHRPGQRSRVTIHRLLTLGTQDMRMPGVLSAKAEVQADLMQAVNVSQTLDAALLAELAGETNDDLNQLWHERL
ncbi:SNF2-related protein [Actinomadura syzygii]|uniref:ATP-dependent helicase n=1 Tax=Actinomadura syzygii TaxID=1427538 RepID=A0A5D0TQJ2_9ACTN|nr:SNF2-related protein [Actinomadura syzygii]TYC08571.1 ATP-dependent helicase [Actinomadura syzygii]